MKQLVVVTSRAHELHDVPDNGYVEVPRRLRALAKGLSKLNLRRIVARKFSDKYVTCVHDPALVRFLKSSCNKIDAEKYEYSYVFPIRNVDKPPRDWSLAVGYYCFDNFTPIHQYAYAAARKAADATLTAAQSLRNGAGFAYAMVRPPGHHAERSHFGGFCYLNSSAIAAQFLSRVGTVAMLDIDYHHGNGQQDIFWHRQDVLTVSVHANPAIAYPYFSGYADEKGEGRGAGYNVNFPLPEVLDGLQYRRTLKKALSLIHDYDPDVIVVPLGFDSARNDPTGSWTLDAPDFFANGQMIAKLNRPILFVQEGGYQLDTLGKNVRAFFSGVLAE